jgi:hypothetical protein
VHEEIRKRGGIKAMRMHGDRTPWGESILANSLVSSLSIPNISFVLFVFFVV